MSEHVSDLALDALRLGVADAEALAHVEGCERCRARRAELDADAAAFAARFDVDALAREALAKAPAPKVIPLRRRAAPFVAVALALAASLVLFIAPSDETRTKGGAREVEVFVVEGGAPRALSGAVDARAELAVKVSPKSPVFVRLLWSSSPDLVEALHPAEGAAAWRVEGASWLEHKITLDGAPEPERLISVLCPDEFDHPAGVAALTRPGACTVEVVEILKR